MKPTQRKRTPKPFVTLEPPKRDPRVPSQLWELPGRVGQANAAGPRYNQTELAERSQLSQSVISKLASWSNLYGLRLDTIFKLARALDVSVCWLLGEHETPERTRRPGKPARKKRRAR